MEFRKKNCLTAAVIGAGFGGLAAALRLKAQGYQVSLIDKMPLLGGRAQVFHHEGHTYDAGPTVITAPFLFDELFQLFGKKREDYISFIPLETWYQFRFDDGKIFEYGNDLNQTLKQISHFNLEDQVGYTKLLAFSKRIFEVGFTQLADKPFHQFKTMLKLIPSLIKLKSYRSVYSLIASFIKDPDLRKAFSIQPLFVGGNPFQTTSIYALIHYLEREWGIYFPKGGTGQLVQALGKLMEEEKIKVRLQQTVDKIIINNKKATGIRLKTGEVIPADIVVVNGDPSYTYLHLIDEPLRRKWTNRAVHRLSYSMGLFVLYFATKCTYDAVPHHTIIMGKEYKKLLDDIFVHNHLSQDVSLYLHRPTATDKSLAPEGCDTFYVLAPVPNLKSKTNWEEVGPRFQELIFKRLEETVLPQLKQNLLHAFYKTPYSFKEEYLSEWGSGFSITPIFRQSAYFRFHNQSEDIHSLYFVGAGTHPGAGLPGVLSSAKVLQNILNEDKK